MLMVHAFVEVDRAFMDIPKFNSSTGWSKFWDVLRLVSLIEIDIATTQVKIWDLKAGQTYGLTSHTQVVECISFCCPKGSQNAPIAL